MFLLERVEGVETCREHQPLGIGVDPFAVGGCGVIIDIFQLFQSTSAYALGILPGGGGMVFADALRSFS